jgi:hypothetical protein
VDNRLHRKPNTVLHFYFNYSCIISEISSATTVSQKLPILNICDISINLCYDIEHGILKYSGAGNCL